MIQPRTAKRIALVHLIVSILLLYFLVALKLPGRAEPSAISKTVGFVWGALNPPLYLIREVIGILTGEPLAFFSVLALQVLWSYGVFVGLLWLIDKMSAKAQ
jgi:hypothetical protein